MSTEKNDQMPAATEGCAAAARYAPDPDDAAYSDWVDSLTSQCTCEGVDRPCDGLLAGGVCDDMHLCSDDFADDLDAHTDQAHLRGATEKPIP